ncbi:MAG TPA: hypothetical protein VJA21_15605 [Verrucomicrobiae bacterium]
MSEEHGKQLSVPASLEFTSTTSPQGPSPAGCGNKTTVLEERHLAKPNPDLDLEVKELLDAVMSLAPRHTLLKNALREYLLSDQTLKKIAIEHSYTPGALVYWVRKLGLPQRPRGRPVLLKPTEDHKRIIAEVRQYGAGEAARREGISKQRVSQIVQRWAPDLKRKRTRKNIVRSRAKRGPTRAIVVSFRLSPDEWRLLETTPVASGRVNISGSKKARAIVLAHITTDGHGGSPTTAVMAHTPEAGICEPVNVYNLKVA